MYHDQDLNSRSHDSIMGTETEGDELKGQMMSPPQFQLFASGASENSSDVTSDFGEPPVQMAKTKGETTKSDTSRKAKITKTGKRKPKRSARKRDREENSSDESPAIVSKVKPEEGQLFSKLRDRKKRRNRKIVNYAELPDSLDSMEVVDDSSDSDWEEKKGGGKVEIHDSFIPDGMELEKKATTITSAMATLK